MAGMAFRFPLISSAIRMSNAHDDIEEKVKLITKCLAQIIYVIEIGEYGELVVCKDGNKVFEFECFRPAMEAMRIDHLQPFMETKVIPTMLQYPGQMIYFGTHGLSVTKRHVC